MSMSIDQYQMVCQFSTIKFITSAPYESRNLETSKLRNSKLFFSLTNSTFFHLLLPLLPPFPFSLLSPGLLFLASLQFDFLFSPRLVVLNCLLLPLQRHSTFPPLSPPIIHQRARVSPLPAPSQQWRPSQLPPLSWIVILSSTLQLPVTNMASMSPRTRLR